MEIRFLKRFADPKKVFIRLANEMRFSRFFLDENIPESNALQLWETSIINHCEGFAAELAVCFLDNEPVGLGTLNFKGNKRVYLHIVGVLKEFQGNGFSQLIIYEIIRKYSDRYKIFVETQSVNKPARKAYQRAGFSLHSIKYILHYWQ